MPTILQVCKSIIAKLLANNIMEKCYTRLLSNNIFYFIFLKIYFLRKNLFFKKIHNVTPSLKINIYLSMSGQFIIDFKYYNWKVKFLK